MGMWKKTSLGVWIWNADESLDLELLKELDYRFIVIKAHDGQSLYNNPAQIDAWRHESYGHGLMFGIWGYLRGPSDANFAAALVDRYRAEFYIADAEVEFEQAKGPWSRMFCQTFRLHHPKLYCGMSSFGRIDLHPGIDWHAWQEHGFDFWPQAYECDSQELTPDECVRAAQAVWAHERIQPVLGAYKGALGRPSSQTLAQSVHGRGYHGVNVWEASSVTREDLTAISEAV